MKRIGSERPKGAEDVILRRQRQGAENENVVYTRVFHSVPSRGFNSSVQTAHTSDQFKYNFYWDPFFSFLKAPRKISTQLARQE